MTSTTIAIEPGNETVSGNCDCCGRETRIFRGYVKENGVARAVYFARYSVGHPERGVQFAVSIGGWGGNKDELKECVAIEWQNIESGPGAMVIDASQSPWSSYPTLGRMLTRSDAMAHGRATDAFRISDAVWVADRRLPDVVLGT